METFRKPINPGGSFEPFREVFESVDEPVHPGAKLLTEVWREREAVGGFVVGRDVPSRALVKILYNLVLFEPVGLPDSVTDMRVCLAGDGLRLRFGRDVTGTRLSELFDDDEFGVHIAQTRMALDDGRPFFLRSEMWRGSLVERRLEIAILPVWNPSHEARWVLVGVFYFP